MRAISFVVLHWLGDGSSHDNVGQDAVNRIRRFHINEREYNDIGYHYLIDRNGKTYTGRPVDQVGAHALGFNTGSVGVNFMFGSQDKELTKEAVTAGAKLLASFHKTYGLTLSRSTVVGHNELLATACPGIVSKHISEMLERAKQITGNNSDCQTVKPTNENINTITVKSPAGETSGLLLNSQAYIHIRDLVKLIPEYSVEWDNKSKTATLQRRKS